MEQQLSCDQNKALGDPNSTVLQLDPALVSVVKNPRPPVTERLIQTPPAAAGSSQSCQAYPGLPPHVQPSLPGADSSVPSEAASYRVAQNWLCTITLRMTTKHFSYFINSN